MGMGNATMLYVSEAERRIPGGTQSGGCTVQTAYDGRMYRFKMNDGLVDELEKADARMRYPIGDEHFIAICAEARDTGKVELECRVLSRADYTLH